MIQRPDQAESFFMLIVYALAAISGGLGGCIVWSYYARFTKRVTVFTLAYMIIGLAFGLVAGTFMLMFSDWLIPELILFSIACGFGGTMAVMGVNWGAGVAFRWKNFEAKFTIRKPDEKRRTTDKEKKK